MKAEEKEVKPVEPREDRQLARRLIFLFFSVFVIFSALVLRLAYVQLVEGEVYLALSETNQTKKLPITAPRGRILDEDGDVLVDNQTVFTVTYQLQDGEANDPHLVASRLSEVLGMPEEEILGNMDVTSQRVSSYIPRRIKADITEEQLAYIEEHREEFPGVEVVPEPIRDYKYRASMSHVLGYTRALSAGEKETYVARGYRPDDRIGKDGIEAQYEEALKGVDGYEEVIVNRNYQKVGVEKRVPPVPGNDLVLTLDKDFQMKVEKILEEAVKQLQKTQPELGVQQASAVVLNPRTGAVRALANYPGYDLNLYNLDPLPSDVYNHQIAPYEENIAIRGVYTPGSVVKPATVLMGMHAGVITPSSKLMSGTFTLPGRSPITDGGRVSGPIDAKTAIQRSSNVFMMNVGEAIVRHYNGSYKDLFAPFLEYYAAFGLGVQTGIDLPGEFSGLQSSSREYGNLLYMTFGQYNSYTPVQLAQYVATIASGGKRIRPYLVQEIREGAEMPGQETPAIWRRTPQVLNQVKAKPEHIADVQEGMRRVGSVSGGTAYRVYQGLPFQVAAKTGTAQTGSKNDNSLIIGYAPYENPEVAFAVVIPKGGGGSAVSGPVSRQILEAYFGLDE